MYQEKCHDYNRMVENTLNFSKFILLDSLLLLHHWELTWAFSIFFYNLDTLHSLAKRICSCLVVIKLVAAYYHVEMQF